MARARFIRPEFFSDEKLASLPFGARLLFAGIWCQCDLRGVFDCSPRLLRSQIFPLDDAVEIFEITAWLNGLVSNRMVRIFEIDGKSFGHVIKWTDHQRISGREKEIGTKRPAPPRGQPRDTPGDTLGTTQVASTTLTLTTTPTTATAITPQPPPPPSDDLFDGSENPARKPLGSRNFADWHIHIGKRVFLAREEMAHWCVLFEAEGWDEMTRGYNYLAAKKPEPVKIFLSDFQGIR